MKNYRIVRLAGLVYQAPMAAFYKRNPRLMDCSYAEQQKALFDLVYVYSDSFSRAMATLGHEAHEIVYDLEPLQKRWAKEHSIKYARATWQSDIILKQIELLRPDVVFYQDIHSLPYSVRRELKRVFPFVRLIIAHKGFPGNLEEMDDLDLLFVAGPQLLQYFARGGFDPVLIYHSFDLAAIERLNTDSESGLEPVFDFTFVGSSGHGYGAGHKTRLWMLEELIKRTDLELWVEELEEFKICQGGNLMYRLDSRLYRWMKKVVKKNDASQISLLLKSGAVSKKIRRLAEKALKEKDRLGEKFPHRCRPPVFGIDMLRVLQRSRVTFNAHTDEGRGYIGNMRLFEATGVGTCLLTDTGANLSDLFVEDQEVVTYRSLEECIEKQRYLLAHDDIRRQIALAGQKRTLKDHTVMNRCLQIDEIIQKRI